MKFRIACLAALVACGSSTEATNAVDVQIVTAARPLTSFAVRNNTSTAVQLVACADTIGRAQSVGASPTVHVCSIATTRVAIQPGEVRSSSAPIATAGQYTIAVTLSDGTVRTSASFSVP